MRGRGEWERPGREQWGRWSSGDVGAVGMLELALRVILQRRRDRSDTATTPLGTRCVSQSPVEVGWALIPGFWSLRVWRNGLRPGPPCDPFLMVPAGLSAEQRQCWSGSQGLAVSMCPSAVPAASAVGGGRLAGRHRVSGSVAGWLLGDYWLFSLAVINHVSGYC